MPKMKPAWNWLTMTMPLAARSLSAGMAVRTLPCISCRMASQLSRCETTASRVRPVAAGSMAARADTQKRAVRNFFMVEWAETGAAREERKAVFQDGYRQIQGGNESPT